MLRQKCNYTSEDNPYCVIKFISRYDSSLTFSYLVISRVKMFGQYVEEYLSISYTQYIRKDKQFVDNVLSRQDTKVIVYNI